MDNSDIKPLIVEEVEGKTIQERFESFHGLNPWVYKALVNITQDWVGKGRKRIGMKMLIEVLRWRYGMATQGDDFKLNNNFTSRYARLIVAEHPEFEGVFETRVLRAS